MFAVKSGNVNARLRSMMQRNVAVISTKPNSVWRMEKSISKVITRNRFLDYGLTPFTRNDISN